MKSTNEHIGQFKIPTNISEYVEKHGDRLVVEQTSMDVVNGYGACIESTVQIKRLIESCPICGYHSYRNPKQKKLIAEQRHKLERRWEVIFWWDTYDPDVASLEECFDEWRSDEEKSIQTKTQNTGRVACPPE